MDSGSIPVIAIALGMVGVGVIGAVLARRDHERHAQGAALLPPIERRSGGFFQRLQDRIDPPREPDPDSFVMLTVVPFSDGPMTHSAIEGAGIEAWLEWVRPPLAHGGFDRYRIVVRQRDLAAASQILDDLRGLGLPPDPFQELE